MKIGSGALSTRVLKTRVFDRWASRQGLDDNDLAAAAIEIEAGLMVAFRQGERCLFIYGFAKNEREDIDSRTLAALKVMARRLLGLSAVDLVKSVQAGELIEVGE